jgi:hypothetical protein
MLLTLLRTDVTRRSNSSSTARNCSPGDVMSIDMHVKFSAVRVVSAFVSCEIEDAEGTAARGIKAHHKQAQLPHPRSG